MENKIMNEINAALKSLDSVADSFGAARSTHIAILGNHLLAIRESALAMQTELEKLRKLKEERTECAKEENPPMRRSLCYVPEEHTECAKEGKEAV